MEPTIYLNFDGNCEEAMRFYAETLGGEITSIFRNSDVPHRRTACPAARTW